MMIHFEIISFLLVILVLVVLWLLFLNSLPTIFLEISRFIAVITFWYVCIFFMKELFLFVTVFSTSRAGTFVLVFYVKGFFIFSWGFCFWLFVHSVKIYRNFVSYFSIVRGWSFSYSTSYIISTIFWYYSGKFDSMWVIFSESSIFTSSFWRSPLSDSSWVIHSKGFIVTSCSLQLYNLLCSLILEAPVVGPYFLKSCIHIFWRLQN